MQLLALILNVLEQGALAGFLGLNLPWLLISPRAWLTSLTLPMSGTVRWA